MPREEVDQFFERLPVHVVDPLTLLRPRRETELSAAFVVAQSRQAIPWPQVQPEYVSGGLQVPDLKVILSQPGLTLAEYPMHSSSGNSTTRWGDMRADAIFLPHTLRAVVMFESKVDSHFTYSDEPPDGQLSRQLEYLASLPLPVRWLVVVCPSFNLAWYGPRLTRAWQASAEGRSVSVCAVTWEAVLSAS
jgi:hypothetical protein